MFRGAEYITDMSKNAEPATSVKIRACYNSIPAQIAKETAKFQYKVVQRGGTASRNTILSDLF